MDVRYYADSLEHLVSVNATTPRLLNMHLQDYIGVANCHIPGKLWGKLFDLSHLYIVPHNTMQVTRRKVSDHHHAGKHTRVPQDLQPAQLT